MIKTVHTYNIPYYYYLRVQILSDFENSGFSGKLILTILQLLVLLIQKCAINFNISGYNF